MKKSVLILLCLALLVSVAVAEDGFLSHGEITLHFPYGDRLGYYTGTTVDGFPDGYGLFETQNSAGEKWFYIGEFSGGLPNGSGAEYFPQYSDHDAGIYQDGILQTGESVGASTLWKMEGTFGQNDRQTFAGKLYNEDGALIFDGSVVDGILMEGTLYDNETGSAVIEGTFGEGFKDFITNHFIGGYLYF